MREHISPLSFLFLCVLALGNVPFLSYAQHDDNGESTCSTSGTVSENSCTGDTPCLLRSGVLEPLNDSAFERVDYLEGKYSASVTPITGAGERVGLKYVKGFLTKEEISKLISLCDGRDGWTGSPQNLDGAAGVHKQKRTSSSCPLIWPQYYITKLDILKDSGKLTKALEEEIHFSWDLSQRLSSFLGVDDVTRVEPLQLIRYEPGQFYKQHHDHGSYYGSETEQRPITFLLFLSTVPVEDGGGFTKFSNLDISVLPRAGDGIVWDNEDDDGNAMVDALHEAVPPGDGGNVIKYALNVWIARDSIMAVDFSNTAVYRTS